jgi:hypothetical protein
MPAKKNSIPWNKGIKTNISPPNKVQLSDILEGKYPAFQSLKLKNKLFDEGIKQRKCEKCNLTEWMCQPIPLELHHINGDSTDHSLINLEVLCSNCHSLTDTFKGKNKGSGKRRR